MADLPPLRDVIAAHGLGARKSLGQNFLLALNLTARIARAAGDMAGRTVVEVGPGPGGLTGGEWPVFRSYGGQVLKEELLEFSGTVIEKLPNAMFKVRLENDHEIIAQPKGKMRKFRIRVMVGDQVDVEMTPYDLTKGRIIFRHK